MNILNLKSIFLLKAMVNADTTVNDVLHFAIIIYKYKILWQLHRTFNVA